MQTKEINTKRLSAVLITILVIAALLIGGFAVLVHSRGRATVHFLNPEGEESLTLFKGSVYTLPEGPRQEGYTFLGWRDAQGNLELRGSLTLYEDTWYAAEYAVALLTEEHPAYLFADGQGFFRPDDALLRSEAAQMLYALLAAPVKAGGNFADVAPDADYAAATSALRELGVVGGSRFHPDEAITRGELFEMLAAFCPPAREEYVFADVEESDPLYAACCALAERGWIDSGKKEKLRLDDTLSRLETAQLMNRITGRSPESSATARQVGAPVDLYEDAEGYGDMIEASIPHRFRRSGEKEIWTGSTPVPKMEPGLHLIGTQLSFIGEDGRILRDESVGNLYFDADGHYTSGSDAVDGQVQQVLSEVLQPGMEQEEMLRALYEYTRDSFTYQRRSPKPSKDTSWLLEEAYDMLTTGKGNCYSYAAVFCVLARAIGYDAIIYNGHIGADFNPHSWVEIEFDGWPYIFDTEMEMAALRGGNPYADFFKMTYTTAGMWSYARW